MYKKATPDGTLAAHGYENLCGIKGVSLGKYGDYAYVCVESNGNGFRLLINDDRINEDNVEIIHTDREWNRK